MKRANLNFILDVLSFIGFIFLCTTGVLMRYVLPAGTGHYLAIFGLDRHQWGAVHFWISVIFLSFLALHLILHGRWLLSIIAGHTHEGSGVRLGLGLVAFLALTALAMAPLIAPVQTIDTTSLELHNPVAITINGSMTLQEVAQANRVPVDYLITTLKLPATVATDQRLGMLKKQYGFELVQVKAIIYTYQNSN